MCKQREEFNNDIDKIKQAIKTKEEERIDLLKNLRRKPRTYVMIFKKKVEKSNETQIKDIENISQKIIPLYLRNWFTQLEEHIPQHQSRRR